MIRLADTWSPAGVTSSARAEHTATLLDDGTVMLVGGFDGSALKKVDRFDPLTGQWTAASSMSVGRSQHVTVPLDGGRLLVAGGRSGNAVASVDARHGPRSTGLPPALKQGNPLR